ncbi:PepSY-associated TM helix domain-containing protein [Carboxylicivirga caseinilyticus]|uniref:PepSY-associated TM helix domain-containing protein n=1 Tax=Carboxylicivirga caseinilyticus TaxID=3417572 RepID=UPI003D343A02|nr:PepSY-associated TM helix domain-containing protein [Marinilabiliaceae bacterium A049]
MKLSSKKIRKWLRILHRDLGYLMVGISLIYGVSGYIMNHINGSDPAFKQEEGSIQIDKNLNTNEIIQAWKNIDDIPEIKRVLILDDSHYRVMLDGGLGIYEVNSGIIDYKCNTKKPIVYFINKLHYNKVKYWIWIGDIFAFSLIFFALSGIFLVKGSKGLSGSGKWYLIAGIIIPLLFLFWI